MADNGALDAAWKSSGGQGDRPAGWYGAGGSASNPNLGGTGQGIAGLGNIQQQYQDAVKPAIQSLQSSIPEIQKTYSDQQTQIQGSKQTLQDRYSSILQDIGNRQTADVNAQTRVTAGELGKRGIQGSSTLAGQEIQNAVQPINAQYATLSRDTGLQNADALRQLDNTSANLADSQVSSLRDVYNTIGNLQASSGQQGIQGALQQYQLQQQAQQQAIQNAIAQQNQTLQQNQYQNISLPTSAANIRNINSEISTRGLQYAAPTQAANYLASIFGMGGGATNRPDISSFDTQDNAVRGGR